MLTPEGIDRNNNKDVQMLKEELWRRRIMAEIMMLKRMTTTDKQDVMIYVRTNFFLFSIFLDFIFLFLEISFSLLTMKRHVTVVT